MNGYFGELRIILHVQPPADWTVADLNLHKLGINAIGYEAKVRRVHMHVNQTFPENMTMGRKLQEIRVNCGAWVKDVFFVDLSKPGLWGQFIFPFEYDDIRRMDLVEDYYRVKSHEVQDRLRMAIAQNPKERKGAPSDRPSYKKYEHVRKKVFGRSPGYLAVDRTHMSTILPEDIPKAIKLMVATFEALKEGSYMRLYAPSGKPLAYARRGAYSQRGDLQRMVDFLNRTSIERDSLRHRKLGAIAHDRS